MEECMGRSPEAYLSPLFAHNLSCHGSYIACKCCLLITFANKLDPDQVQYVVAPDQCGSANAIHPVWRHSDCIPECVNFGKICRQQ